MSSDNKTPRDIAYDGFYPGCDEEKSVYGIWCAAWAACLDSGAALSAQAAPEPRGSCLDAPVGQLGSFEMFDYPDGFQRPAWIPQAAIAAPEPLAPVAWRYRFHPKGSWHLADEQITETVPEGFEEQPLYLGTPRAAIGAPADDVAELRAQIERLTIRGEAYENAYRIAYQATYQSHSGHWDKTGGSGAGCPECIRAREARENCDAALKEGLTALAARAETQRSSRPSEPDEPARYPKMPPRQFSDAGIDARRIMEAPIEPLRPKLPPLPKAKHAFQDPEGEEPDIPAFAQEQMLLYGLDCWRAALAAPPSETNGDK